MKRKKIRRGDYVKDLGFYCIESIYYSKIEEVI